MRSFRIKDPTFASSVSHEKFFSGINVLKGDQFSKPAEESKRIHTSLYSEAPAPQCSKTNGLRCRRFEGKETEGNVAKT